MTDKELAAALRRGARQQHKGMPTGGRHGTKKGAKGYTRKRKHANKRED